MNRAVTHWRAWLVTVAAAAALNAPRALRAQHRDLVLVGGWLFSSTGTARVHNPGILIEFDHQPGIALDNDDHTRNHTHTLVRTPNGNDYGRDLLRQHYRQFDHSRPDSPHRQGKI